MKSRVIQGLFPGGQPRLAAVAPAPAGATARPGPPAPVFTGAPRLAQRRGGDGAFAVDAARLGLVATGGRRLPDAVRIQMEGALGADFAAVRVHVGPQAERIGAVAFTTGDDLYFAPGRYQPETVAGRQLLGHELAHVVQQRQGRVRAGAGVAVVQDRALEAEADRLGQRAAVFRARSPAVQPATAIGHRWQPARIAARPMLAARAAQRMEQANNTLNTYEIGFTQDTVGPNFTSVPTGVAARLANIRSSAAEIKKTGQQPAWLGIAVFRLTSPTSGLSRTFSLDNRRLFVANDAGLGNLTVNWANFETVYRNIFKFTAQSDWDMATVTGQAQNRLPPPTDTILGEFVAFILNQLNVTNVGALPDWGLIPNLGAFVLAVTTAFQFNELD